MEETLNCEKKMKAVEEKHTSFLNDFNALNQELYQLFDKVTARRKNRYRNNSIVNDINTRLFGLEKKRIELMNLYFDEYSTYEAIKAAETTHDYLVNDIRAYSEKKLAPELSVPNWNGRPRSKSFPGAFKNLLTRKKGGKRKQKTRKH
jgi:hypothetical protein